MNQRTYRLVLVLPSDTPLCTSCSLATTYWQRTFKVSSQGSGFVAEQCNDGVLHHAIRKLGADGPYFTCTLLMVGEALRSQILEVMTSITRQNLLPKGAYLEVL